MPSTGHTGLTLAAHCPTVSDSTASSLARSASFARTLARCPLAISRTSAHEARPDPSKSNRARISSRLKPKSLARRICSRTLAPRVDPAGEGFWVSASTKSAPYWIWTGQAAVCAEVREIGQNRAPCQGPAPKLANLARLEAVLSEALFQFSTNVSPRMSCACGILWHEREIRAKTSVSLLRAREFASQKPFSQFPPLFFFGPANSRAMQKSSRPCEKRLGLSGNPLPRWPR